MCVPDIASVIFESADTRCVNIYIHTCKQMYVYIHVYISIYFHTQIDV